MQICSEKWWICYDGPHSLSFRINKYYTTSNVSKKYKSTPLCQSGTMPHSIIWARGSLLAPASLLIQQTKREYKSHILFSPLMNMHTLMDDVVLGVLASDEKGIN